MWCPLHPFGVVLYVLFRSLLPHFVLCLTLWLPDRVPWWCPRPARLRHDATRKAAAQVTRRGPRVACRCGPGAVAHRAAVTRRPRPEPRDGKGGEDGRPCQSAAAGVGACAAGATRSATRRQEGGPPTWRCRAQRVRDTTGYDGRYSVRRGAMEQYHRTTARKVAVSWAGGVLSGGDPARAAAAPPSPAGPVSRGATPQPRSP